MKAAAHSSECEVRAMNAERSADDCYMAEYMRQHIGEEATGVISGVTMRGVFVELPNTVEGFVPITSFEGAHFEFDGMITQYDATTGRKLTIGQPLRVEFSLAPSAAARHPERSEAQPSEVEGSRAATAHYPPDRRSRRRCDRARAYEAGDGRRRACACRSPGSNSVSARIARGRTRRGCGYRLLAAAPRARRRARRPCAAAARAHAQPCVAACAGAHGACARAPRGVRIAAWATNPACARAAKRAGADIIYVPALNYKRGEAVVAGQRSATAEQAGYPKQAVVALPTVEHDQVPGTRERAIDFDPWRSSSQASLCS